MGKTQSWFLRDPLAGDQGSKLQTGLVSSAREDGEPAVPLGEGAREGACGRACLPELREQGAGPREATQRPGGPLVMHLPVSEGGAHSRDSQRVGGSLR